MDPNLDPLTKRKSLFCVCRTFSILEVLCAFALLLIASGLIGFRLVPLLEKKRFHTAFERMKTELTRIYYLGCSMQSDWIVHIEKKGEILYFEALCPEYEKVHRVSWLAPFHLQWNDKNVSILTFHLSSTGAFFPKGEIAALGKKEKKSEDLSRIFGVSSLNHISPKAYP